MKPRKRRKASNPLIADFGPAEHARLAEETARIEAEHPLEVARIRADFARGVEGRLREIKARVHEAPAKLQ
jgi:hypothetical protein